MFITGLIVGAFIGSAVSVLFMGFLTAGKREDQVMAQLCIKEAKKRTEEKKRIHFVDAFNGELFSIADGEGIQLTSGDGEAQVAICRYLDENHMKIDRKVWQIQEFARRMQEIGITFAPLAD